MSGVYIFRITRRCTDIGSSVANLCFQLQTQRSPPPPTKRRRASELNGFFSITRDLSTATRDGKEKATVGDVAQFGGTDQPTYYTIANATNLRLIASPLTGSSLVGITAAPYRASWTAVVWPSMAVS